MLRIIAILLLLAAPALAQPAPTSLDQALAQKLLEEVNLNVQLRTQLIEAQAKIKELEEKANAKPKPKTSSNDGRGSP